MRRRPLLVVSIALTFVLGACGEGGGGGGTAAPPPTGTPVTGTPVTPTVSLPSALDPPATEEAARGQRLFQGTCVACHGMDAMGLPGLGKPLVGNAFLAGLADDEVIAFLRVGRPADHPDNTTGIAMPPMGGNTALTDQDLANILAFLRSLAV